MPDLRTLPVEVTLEEAAARYEADQHWIRTRMEQHGFEYREPSEHIRNASLYEHMSGDHVPPWEAEWLNEWEWSERVKELADKTYGPGYAPSAAARRLRFWTKKYQYMRDVADSELKGFLIDQINAARRGE